MTGGEASDSALSFVAQVDRVTKLASDTLVIENAARSRRVRDLISRFGFLFDVNHLISDDTNTEILREDCVNFGHSYEEDVNGCALHQETVDCRMLYQDCQKSSSALEPLKKSNRIWH
jgi:hypothetical protein